MSDEPAGMVGAPPCGRPDESPTGMDESPFNESPAPFDKGPAGIDQGQARGPAPTVSALSLPDVVHRFKTLTTKRYIDGVKQSNWAPFAGRVWHRNYYEHIIRNEDSLTSIRQYIIDNPGQWQTDPENISVTGAGKSSRGRIE